MQALAAVPLYGAPMALEQATSGSGGRVMRTAWPPTDAAEQGNAKGEPSMFGVSAPVNDVCIDSDLLSAGAGLTERLA